MSKRVSIEVLIARSSLGTPGVRRLARRSSPEIVGAIVRRAGVPADPLPTRDDLDRPGPIGGTEVATAQLRAPGVNTPERTVMARKTSSGAAKAASKVLRDGRTGKASKTAAGSALSQAAPKKKGK